MNAIILATMPADTFMEIKIPMNVTPEQFDLIMNRIKLDFFGTIKPANIAQNSSFSITQYDEKDVKGILATCPTLEAVEDLIALIGNPASTPDWTQRFWKFYSQNNPVIGKTLMLLKKSSNARVIQQLNDLDLGWLLDFVNATCFR